MGEDKNKKITITIHIGLIIVIVLIALFFLQVWPNRYSMVVNFENITSFGQCDLSCNNEMDKRNCFSANSIKSYELTDNTKNFSCECVLHTCLRSKTFINSS